MKRITKKDKEAMRKFSQIVAGIFIPIKIWKFGKYKITVSKQFTYES